MTHNNRPPIYPVRFTWRKQLEHTQSVSEREANLATENARLKRQLAQQAEELAILLVPVG